MIQGSGSGHEPAHVMAVGKGCSTPPVPATCSRPRRWIRARRRASCCSPKGVLGIVNNYTGDRMAFDIGREMAEAEGIKVGTVIVNDDVAVQGLALHRRPARRGRQLLRHQGDRRGARAGRRPRRAVDQWGRRSTPSPGRWGWPSPRAPPGQGLAAVRAGRGRDGDGRRHPRRARAPPGEAREPRTAIVDELVEAVGERPAVGPGDEVAVMVNGLGGTPISELYLIYG